MPLLFLVPAVLAGLAALVVPLVLHLRRREREKPMRFPSLMFLKRVTITTARRRRITDLPLLLLRALIITLAVVAFARPVLRPKPAAKAAAGTRRVVLLIDHSMSMSHLAVWPALLDSARAAINALNAGDRVAVVAFDETATVEQPFTADRATALASLKRITPTALGTRFGAAIRAARELLVKEADATGGDVLLLSDLQRTGAAGMEGLKLPPTVQFHAIDVSPALHGNSAVTGITIQRLAGTDDTRKRIAVSAQLVGRSLAAPRHVTATLAVNGRSSGTRAVTIPVNGPVNVAFDAVTLPIGGVQLVVSIDHDSLTADDQFDAVVPAQLTRRVILVTPTDLADGETFYLERALETGDDPALRIERRNAGALDAATLRDAAVVFLYDVAPPAGSAGTALAAWIHDGGGLIEAASTRLAARASTSTLAPGSVHAMVDRTINGGVLGAASLEHPIFAPFRGGASAPLGDARYFRYPRLTPTADAQVVAHFDDGLPALLERAEGTGRVLMTAMPLDATSGDFPLQPTYLPFVRGMALYAAGGGAAPLFRVAGDGWVLPTGVRNPVVKTPSGKLLRPDSAGTGPVVVLLDEAGYYAAYETRAGGDPLVTVAANPASRESDLTQMPASEVLVGVGEDSVKASVLSAATLAEAEQRQRIWRTLLLLAIVAVIAEAIMASRGWRGVAAEVVGIEGSSQ